jgi:hypothetical protein
VDSGLPVEVAAYAARATSDAIRKQGGRLQRIAAIESYFDKVAARRLVRRHGGSNAAARMVASCVVADLMAAGRSPSDVYDELARGWATALPSCVLEEYRRRLCA